MTKTRTPSSLKTLVMMQLKEKMDLSFLKSKKNILFKLVFSFIAIAIITAALYLVFNISIKLRIFTITATLPSTLLVTIFTFMELLAIISCTLGLTKALYFSSDNQLLLTFPVKADKVFFSKLIVFYINELRRNFTFMLPLFLAFGLANHLKFTFLPILIVAFFFLSCIPVVIGAILSLPTMLISMVFKRFKLLQTLIYAGLFAVVVVYVFKLASSIPDNFNLIGRFGHYYWAVQDFLTLMTKIFVPFRYLVDMIMGKIILFVHHVFPISSLYTFLALVGCIAVGLLFAYLIARPLFFKMASKPFEYKKKTFKNQKQNLAKSPFGSTMQKELKLTFRSPESTLALLLGIVILPFAILLLNTFYIAMNTSSLGQNMTISFNFLIILLILLTSNSWVASIFSREGAAIYLLKTKPSRVELNAFGKLLPTIIANTVSIFATAFVLYFVGRYNAYVTSMLTLSTWFVCMAHLCWSAELDIIKPQYGRYIDGATADSNPNETRSTTIAFLLAFILAGWSLLVGFKDAGVAVWWKLCILTFGLFALRFGLFMARVKTYFREI